MSPRWRIGNSAVMFPSETNARACSIAAAWIARAPPRSFISRRNNAATEMPCLWASSVRAGFSFARDLDTHWPAASARRDRSPPAAVSRTAISQGIWVVTLIALFLSLTRSVYPRRFRCLYENHGVEKFAVVINEDAEGGFWAEVPALPGCYSQGDSVPELMANVREANTGAPEVMRQQGLHPESNIQILNLAI